MLNSHPYCRICTWRWQTRTHTHNAYSILEVAHTPFGPGSPWACWSYCNSRNWKVDNFLLQSVSTQQWVSFCWLTLKRRTNAGRPGKCVFQQVVNLWTWYLIESHFVTDTHCGWVELFCGSVGCCCWASVNRSCSYLCKGSRSKHFEMCWMAPGYRTSGGIWFVSVRISTTKLGKCRNTALPFIGLPYFLCIPFTSPPKKYKQKKKPNLFFS